MELYTLDSVFSRSAFIEPFNTCIWTERYDEIGDFKVTLPATPSLVSMLSPGVFVANSESEETGIIHTALVENELLTISGPFLADIYKNRIIRSTDNHEDRYWRLTTTVGLVIDNLIAYSCIAPFSAIPDPTYADVANLELYASVTGPSITAGIPFGPVYTPLQELCRTYGYGFKLLAHKPTEGTYTLRHHTYAGRNLGRDQSTYPAVIFEPALDNLSGSKELRSIAGYKNVAYAYSPGLNPSTFGTNFVGYAAVPGEGATTDFNRRVLMIFADDITTDQVGSAATLQALLNQRAADGLANNNYVRLADGQIVPQVGYQYGVDYFLGDIIELKGKSGIYQKARITEYIRAHDETGHSAYPTLSLI
jgi:Siphovirus ReqiPepy6 Gp37-like protein